MKTITATLIALLISLQMMADKVIKNPEIEFSASWMTITEIELTKEATIVRGTLMPHCSIINNTVLADRNTGKEFKFLRVEGIKAYEQATKETPCTVYFEPLDANVKEFNYIEVGNNPLGNYYGIKLQPKAKASKKAKGFDPESLNYDYYMNQPFTPDNEWKFSNEPYKGAIESGKALLKIHVTKIPKELASILPNATARVQNQITRQEENSVVSMDEDNCYTLDLNIPHAQFVFTQPFGDVFVAPGDTIEIFSTIDSAPDGSGPRFKTFRSNSESAMINTLLPKFMEKYGRKEYEYEEAQATIEKGKDATQALLERWANQANEIIADEELRQALINSPLSTRGKDLVMISLLTNKCIEIEDVVSSYTHKANTYTQKEDGSWNSEPNPNYVKLDLQTVYGTLLKNKELIYNNPLALSESSQWVFVNRTLYGPLLFSWEPVKIDENYYSQRRRDDYGMAGTFMNDLYLSQDIVRRLEDIQKEDKLGNFTEHREEILDAVAKGVGEALAGIQNVNVAQTITSEYRKFVKATDAAAADNGNNWTEEQQALWNKIVSPYKGNTLFLDFWGMSCGPCRSGMMSQKKLVEEMKDEKVKFIYITTEDQKPSAEKWMGENNIKGEHVYVTQNEWKQLEAMINFTAIPRGALVNKEGKLIESDFHVGQFNSEELKKLAERF
ncbi:MAG: redoxin family protein [Bacteroidaceae bacterium]|nr:redoxin family protein [Bacteroidaceae bacterium]